MGGGGVFVQINERSEDKRWSYAQQDGALGRQLLKEGKWS